MRALLIGVGAILAAVASGQAPAPPIRGAVVRVLSGDTLVLAAAAGEIEVRLSDIGAPQGPQFYAPAARALLDGIMQGRTIDVAVTGAAGEGRVFGRARAGELDINLELVRRGAAWVCWEYARDTSYLPWESRAQRARIGLWSSTPEITALSECRRRPPAEAPLFPRN